jgi:hypothetical protein
VHTSTPIRAPSERLVHGSIPRTSPPPSVCQTDTNREIPEAPRALKNSPPGSGVLHFDDDHMQRMYGSRMDFYRWNMESSQPSVGGPISTSVSPSPAQYRRKVTMLPPNRTLNGQPNYLGQLKRKKARNPRKRTHSRVKKGSQ